MKKFSPLLAGALSLGILFSSAIPAAAATNDKTVETKKESKETKKQKLDEMKKQVKLQKKKNKEGQSYTEATVNIDGVDAVILLDEGQELTEEMLTKSAKFIEEEKMAADLRAINEAVQIVPNTGTISSTAAPVESDITIVPFSVPPPETDGYLVGNSYHSFSNLSASVANTLFHGYLAAIFTYASIKVTDNTPVSVAIGAVAGMAGDFEPYKAHWTQERVWESWSSYYGAYLDDLSITHYTSSSYSTVKTVHFKYDIKRMGS